MKGIPGSAEARARAAIPRVSTRGRYDLETGRLLPGAADYDYALRFSLQFAVWRAGGGRGGPEMALVVHGMRNGRTAASEKFAAAEAALRRLGYRRMVAGYSYDSNTKGAHRAATAARALAAARRIAGRNGAALARFVTDTAERNTRSRRASVRLLGHSLGSHVIFSALDRLARSPLGGGSVESVHLFGASVPAGAPAARGDALRAVVRGPVVNYHAPTDEVLAAAASRRPETAPLGLRGAAGPGRPPPNYEDRRVEPEDHRFQSYLDVLESFP